MIVSPKILFAKALAGKYAIPAFNVNNMEMIQGIMNGVAAEKSPVILQVSAGARKYAGPIFLRKLIEAAAEEFPAVPFAVHLDHGEDFAICKSCIENDFNSVMIDASRFEFDENVARTREVVDFAKPKNVAVEAELGKLAGVEDNVSVDARDAKFTDAAEAAEFVAKTECDSLAIAVGTSHGAFKFTGEPFLSFERIAEIEKNLPNFPLVLHGASSVLENFVKLCNDFGGEIAGARGVSEELLHRAATQTNICKINIDTDLRLVMTGSIRKNLAENPANFDPRKFLGAARDEFEKMVRHKVRVCGSENKA